MIDLENIKKYLMINYLSDVSPIRDDIFSYCVLVLLVE